MPIESNDHTRDQLIWPLRGFSNLRNRFIDGIYSEVDRHLDGFRVCQCNRTNRFRQGFQSYCSSAISIHSFGLQILPPIARVFSMSSKHLENTLPQPTEHIARRVRNSALSSFDPNVVTGVDLLSSVLRKIEPSIQYVKS